MRVVAVDTSYWVGSLNRDDQWHESAKRARSSLGQHVQMVTTDEVLAEFLAFVSRGGARFRKHAVETVRSLHADRNVEVVPQTRESFNRALKRYEERGYTAYSLTDCVLIALMEERGIGIILTSDGHFEKEGFTVLMKKRIE